MGNLLRSSLAVAVGSLALAFAPNTAEAVTVNVDGTNYDVTFFTGVANSNLSKFQTTANGGQMPWWGNSTLAKSFATAVDSQLGKPNIGTWGPYFGFAPESGFPRNESWYFNGDTNEIKRDFFTQNFSASWAVATLTPPPSAVPGPLPLFGAAAAFGMSRRLRRRIQRDG